MYYKSIKKVQITQRSSNHSTKYKPFNVLYKSFNIVQIIQRSTYHSTLYKSFNDMNIFQKSIFVSSFVKHTVSSNTKAQLKKANVNNIICCFNAMRIGGGSRIAATSKMELFVIIVNG